MRQQNRQPATKDAVLRRLRDAELERLPDRRGRRGRRYPYLGLVMALALGAVAALRSLREVEALTAGLRPAVRRRSRITRRYSDTKLRDTLLGLHPEETRVAIHRQVKAEHRRGNLKPTRLPFGVVAIDGKWLGKLDQWDHPDVQPVRPEERSPYGLARVHRAHLVSSEATVCVDERPIPGHTNELGAVCAFTQELIAAWIRVPQAVYALSALRMIALNILAVIRRLSRREYTSKQVPWREVARLAHFALAGPAIVLSERLAFE